MKNKINKKNELNPYNPQFPVQYFKHNIESKLSNAEKVIDFIYKEVIRESSLLSQAKQATEKGFRFIVDTSEEMLKAIDEGKIKLTTSKDGKIYAQLLRSDGKYDKKLPIKKETFAKGIDSTELANALQLKVLQEQIVDISNQIFQLDLGIQEILKGQQNDRIGLYYSAISLLVESMAINDAHLREALIVQGIRSLSDSIFQLTLKLRDDIQYLENKEYEKVKGKKRIPLIEEKVQSISQTFAFIHQDMMIKAGAYCKLDEMGAMITVLNEYSRFIENDIKTKAPMLSQLDSNDNGLETGIWKSRALLSFDTIDFDSHLLNSGSEQVLYIGLEEEK